MTIFIIKNLGKSVIQLTLIINVKLLAIALTAFTYLSLTKIVNSWNFLKTIGKTYTHYEQEQRRNVILTVTKQFEYTSSLLLYFYYATLLTKIVTL